MKDVDVSFSYEHVKATFDLRELNQTTAYSYKAQRIPFLFKNARLQLSSTQIQDLISLAKLIFSIACAAIP